MVFRDKTALLKAAMNKVAVEGAVSQTWVGGSRAGYSILDAEGHELIRVWCESHAKEVILTGFYNPEQLVDRVLEIKPWSIDKSGCAPSANAKT